MMIFLPPDLSAATDTMKKRVPISSEAAIIRLAVAG